MWPLQQSKKKIKLVQQDKKTSSGNGSGDPVQVAREKSCQAHDKLMKTLDEFNASLKTTVLKRGQEAQKGVRK